MKAKEIIKAMANAYDEQDSYNGDVIVRGIGLSCSVEPEAIFVDEDGCLQILIPANWRPQ